MEKFAKDKHSSFFQKFVNCGQKCFKTFATDQTTTNKTVEGDTTRPFPEWEPPLS